MKEEHKGIPLLFHDSRRSVLQKHKASVVCFTSNESDATARHYPTISGFPNDLLRSQSLSLLAEQVSGEGEAGTRIKREKQHQQVGAL